MAPMLRVFIRMHGGATGTLLASRLMPCRADALAIGILVAYAWRTDAIRQKILANPARLYQAFLVLLAGMAALWWRFPNQDNPITQSAGHTVIAVFYAIILMVSIGFRSNVVARFTRWGLLREFGRISYCLYLIHMAVRFFCFGFLLRLVLHFSNRYNALAGLVSIAAAYGIARLSWTYFEHPLLQRGHLYKYEAARAQVSGMSAQ